ncbi:hypothetical protein NDU88_008693 [Pleurodeles waltl]|uniref:Uncharacterized protein n=1 Tax=Pleurodeles waltl TaxID=8319 RepID=A0AAV7RYC8_PLEWA|nr:hypothetical protein NDU88_008693 [Pleurodeles waltl]
MQESGSEHTKSPPADTQLALKENYILISGEITHSEGVKETFHGSNPPPTMLQGANWGPMDTLGNGDEQKGSNGEEVKAPTSRSMQSQQVEFKGGAQDIQDEVDTLPEMSSGGSMGGRHAVKNLEVGAKKIGTRKKVLDWSKDGGDKFYSLTEDSDATSSGCNRSEIEGSISSDSGSASSTAESTVQQQRRQRKCLKTRTGPTVARHLNGTTQELN